MARLIVARAKSRSYAVVAVFASLACVDSVAFSQQNNQDGAYSYTSTPTQIPGLSPEKKPWYSKVGGSISKGWNATTGVVKKAMPSSKKTPKTDKNDPVHLGGNAPNASAELHAGMAQVFMEQGRNDLAIKHFQDAIKLDPNNVKALRGHARFLQRQGKADDAEQQIRRALKIAPDSPGTLNDLGMNLAQQGKRAAAIQALERAIALRPRKALYRNNAAALLIEMGQTERAYTHLTTAHGEAKAHYNVGYLLAKTGKRQAAAAHFGRALQLDSSMVAARQWLDQLHGRRPAEMVAQRPVDVRPPVVTPRVRSAPPAAPRTATAPSNVQSPADQFWGRPPVTSPSQSQFETSPAPSSSNRPPMSQSRTPSAAIRAAAPAGRSAGGPSAANQFWGRSAQRSSAPVSPPQVARPNYVRPHAPVANPAAAPSRVSPPTVAPSRPAGTRTLPSQQFQPYRPGTPPTPGAAPGYVSDARYAPSPSKNYRSPVKFGKQGSSYVPPAVPSYR